MKATTSVTIAFAYFPFGDSGTAQMSKKLTIGATAPSSISIPARAARAGGKVAVRGTAAPTAKGILVDLQLFQKGYGWNPIGSTRTNAHGGWTFAYHTRSGLAPHAVKIRAVINQQDGWHYLTTVTKALGVTIR